MSPTPAADSVLVGQDVLLRLPLALVAAILIFLGLLIGIGGWLLARRRRVDGRRRPYPTGNSWLSDVLGALPCGAVLVDARGRIELVNQQARRWIGEIESLADLPAEIKAVVDRTVASGLTEGVTVNVITDADHRSWIEAAPLGDGGDVHDDGQVATDLHPRDRGDLERACAVRILAAGFEQQHAALAALEFFFCCTDPRVGAPARRALNEVDAVARA